MVPYALVAQAMLDGSPARAKSSLTASPAGSTLSPPSSAASTPPTLDAGLGHAEFNQDLCSETSVGCASSDASTTCTWTAARSRPGTRDAPAVSGSLKARSGLRLSIGRPGGAPKRSPPKAAPAEDVKEPLAVEDAETSEPSTSALEVGPQWQASLCEEKKIEDTAQRRVIRPIRTALEDNITQAVHDVRLKEPDLYTNWPEVEPRWRADLCVEKKMEDIEQRRGRSPSRPALEDNVTPAICNSGAKYPVLLWAGVEGQWRSDLCVKKPSENVLQRRLRSPGRHALLDKVHDVRAQSPDRGRLSPRVPQRVLRSLTETAVDAKVVHDARAQSPDQGRLSPRVPQRVLRSLTETAVEAKVRHVAQDARAQSPTSFPTLLQAAQGCGTRGLRSLPRCALEDNIVQAARDVRARSPDLYTNWPEVETQWVAHLCTEKKCEDAEQRRARSPPRSALEDNVVAAADHVRAKSPDLYTNFPGVEAGWRSALCSEKKAGDVVERRLRSPERVCYAGN